MLNISFLYQRYLLTEKIKQRVWRVFDVDFPSYGWFNITTSLPYLSIIYKNYGPYIYLYTRTIN